MKNRYNLILENGLKMGGLLGAIFIFLSLIYYIAEFDMFNIMFGIINFLILLALYIGFLLYSNKTVRAKKLEGAMNYPEGLLNAFVTGAVAALVSTLYNYLFYTFFDPEYLQVAMQNAIEMIENNPAIPPEAMEEAIEKMEKMTPAKSAIQGLTTNLILSLVFALILALFTRKKADIFSETAD